MTDEIALGDTVKILFYPSRFVGSVAQQADPLDPSNFPERMWVRVTDVGGPRLTGTLANDPICCTHLKFGDTVNFTLDDIIAHERTDP